MSSTPADNLAGQTTVPPPNPASLDTARAARQLAEQRLDAEQKRFEVGMSTSFLVIQAQRDLAQASTNELAAVLAYDLSLVDFEALQQAGPAGEGQSRQAAQASTQPAATSAAPTAAAGTRSATPSTAASGLPTGVF